MVKCARCQLDFLFCELRQSRSFLDSLWLSVRGGAGGCGQPKYGGVGGKGGDIVIEASAESALEKVLIKYPSKKVHAPNGENSIQKCILGRSARDVIVHVPVGVNVVTEDRLILGELIRAGDRIVAAKGGPGGCPETGYGGLMGEARKIRLDLKLIADIGLVGFPNAGKSTLLAAMTDAKPKIASYPFTTIKPNVGIMQFPDKRAISVADLPGLVEGSYKNVGMGHEFLRHCERTKLLLFVVDILGFQLNTKYPKRNCLETVVLLNKEIELYREALLDKPAVLVINKMDLHDAPKKFEEIEERLNNLNEILQDFPSNMRPLKPIKFDEIVPLSAKNRPNDVLRLKRKLRKHIDMYAEEGDEEAENNLLEDIRSRLVERGPLLV